MKKSKLSKTANTYLHAFNNIQMSEEKLKKEKRKHSKMIKKKWAKLEKEETKLVQRMVRDIV